MDLNLDIFMLLVIFFYYLIYTNERLEFELILSVA